MALLKIDFLQVYSYTNMSSRSQLSTKTPIGIRRFQGHYMLFTADAYSALGMQRGCVATPLPNRR